MNLTRRAPKIMFYLFTMIVLIGVLSACLSTKKRNSRSESPKKGKMKPCNCPHFGEYKTCYDANGQFC